MAVSLPFVKVSLTENDVPGSEFVYENVDEHTVVQLKRWLQCRGLKTSGNKQQLIARCKEAISFGNLNISNAVDGGRIVSAKVNEERRKVLQDITERPPLFPVFGWKKFPSCNIPESFSYHNIYLHLVHSAVFISTVASENAVPSVNEDLSCTDVHTGKPLNRGRLYFKSGHVIDMEDTCIGKDYYCIRAKVIASFQIDVKYNVLVMVKTELGTVSDSSCECKASAMGRCSHVAALLFALEDYTILYGYTPPACTSVLCSWNSGRKKKDPSQIFSKPYSSKREHLARIHFDPRHCNQESKTDDEQMISFLQNLQSFSAKQKHPSMWEQILEFKYLEYALTTVEKDLLLANVIKFIGNVTPINSVPQIVPGTEGQATSTSWLNTRWCYITASNCKEFATDHKNLSTVYNLVEQKLWKVTHLSSIPAVSYGIQNENHALQEYATSSQVDIQPTGLWINPNLPGLAASPDSLVYDPLETDPYGLVEIKCPFSMKNIHPLDLDLLTVHQKRNFCCSLDEKKLKLKCNHKYFYQVQMQMAVTGRTWCDFVIWTPLGISVERVNFSPSFWMPVKEKLFQFYKGILIPEFFEKRVPRGLQPFDLR